MKTRLFILAFCVPLLLVGFDIAAGEANPTPQVVPVPITVPAPNGTTPPKPTVAINTSAGVEMLALITDLETGDAAKRDATVKTLVTKGAHAYRSMVQLLNAKDADVAGRAKDVRSKIEKRAMELFHETDVLQGKALSGARNPAALEDVRKAWIAVAQYVPQPELRQQAVQSIQTMQMLMDQTAQFNKDVEAKDAELAAKPAPAGIQRAAIQLARAQAFTNLQRYDDAQKAAQDAFEAGGRDCRLASAALKTQIEMMVQKADYDGMEKISKKIIAEYGESLEARYAYGALSEVLMERKRWDEAVDNVKKFVAACPLDEEPQEIADKLLDTLMDKERDYPRAYGLSTWIKQRLPASRVRLEVVKILGECSEYALKDFAKAEIAYKTLATDYPDVIAAPEISAALKRIRAKIAGTFPKEPMLGDEGPAGALGQFIAAVRLRDGKKLGESVPANEAIEAAGKLTCEECELIRVLTFGDFIVKKVNIDGEKAEIDIEYYDSASSAPKAIKEKAILEKGAWKIQWTDPDEQLNPTPTTKPSTVLKQAK